MNENLNQLRKIAQNATPGPWSADVGVRGDCVVFGPNGRFLLNAQAEPHWLEYPGETRSVAFDVDRRDCTHIATFDPPTVLALLDRVEAAEATIQRVRELATVAQSWASQGNMPLVRTLSEYILRALDGGEQE